MNSYFTEWRKRPGSTGCVTCVLDAIFGRLHLTAGRLGRKPSGVRSAGVKKTRQGMDCLFVTGATGFVGRNLVLRALAAGTPVLAPVRDEGKFRAQVVSEGCSWDGIQPLACDPSCWPGGIRPSHAVLSAGVLFARERAEYFRTNVDWNLEVLAALPADCRIVVLSSQSAGGPTPGGRDARAESDPDAPVTWYGESKLALERAIAEKFPGRPITVLRPPMILGARDTATLPLFKMARNFVRVKPGLRAKHFSFLGVDDVLDAIMAAFDAGSPGPFYIAGGEVISDWELIQAAARVAGRRGVTIPVPLPLIGLFARVVDAIPSLRAATPSLTRDRVREIWPARWVVDGAAFRRLTGWQPRIPLDQALSGAFEYFRAGGRL